MTKSSWSLFTSDSNVDMFGAMASTLCLIHCMLTPLIFVAQAAHMSCAELSPWWWKIIDYAFLGVSYFAILHTTKTTTSKWMPSAMWFSWVVLALVIINESLHLVPLSHFMIYIPAISLVVLHLYNRKYCKCKNDSCCVEV